MNTRESPKNKERTLKTIKMLPLLLLASLAGCATGRTNTGDLDKARLALSTGAAGHEGGAAVAPNGEAAEVDEARRAVGSLHDLLAPYGAWNLTARYGWTWGPDARWAGADFFPYVSGGRWLHTDRGWFFHSDLPWGWITFHYGRWLRDAYRGWVWVPGSVWAPAWVAWRAGGDMVGWAPLPPRRFRKIGGVASPMVFCRAAALLQDPPARGLLPAGELTAALKATVPLWEKVTHKRSRWYRGPDPARVGTPARWSLPQELPDPGVLVRARPGSKQRLTLVQRGTVRLVRRRPGAPPPAPGHRPGKKPGRVPSAPVDVVPVMPPLGDDEGRRWR